VGPFDFFRAPRAAAAASVPVFCGATGYSTISVQNALPTSLYTWETFDGHIVSGLIGPTIDVDMPGDYIVSQQIMDSCGISYAKDTVTVTQDLSCSLLKTLVMDFTGERLGDFVRLNWKMSNNQSTSYYEVERRLPGGEFISIANIPGEQASSYTYHFTDDVSKIQSDVVYYRLKLHDLNGNIQYTKTIVQTRSASKSVLRVVKTGGSYEVVLNSENNGPVLIEVFNVSGAKMLAVKSNIAKGGTMIPLQNLSGLAKGMYFVRAQVGAEQLTSKVIVGN